jgi:hypothetical protein
LSARLLVEPADIGDQLPTQLQPNPLGGAAGPKHAQRRNGLGGGQVGGDAAGQQFPQQPVQLVDGAGSVLRQVHTALIE